MKLRLNNSCLLLKLSVFVLIGFSIPHYSYSQISTECAVDECGVCNGDNKDKGCDGVCFSEKEFDECGVCEGSGAGECGCDLSITKDTCGVCGGGDALLGCDGTCGSETKLDDCGICAGNNNDKGCDGICFSGKTVDSCGICGGNEATKGCDGVCGSTKIFDECGVCGGEGLGVCGCNTEIVKDECGVCGGTGESYCGCPGAEDFPIYSVNFEFYKLFGGKYKKHLGSEGWEDIDSLDEPKIVGGNGSNLTCLENIFNSVASGLDQTSTSIDEAEINSYENGGSYGSVWLDDNFYEKIAQTLGVDPNSFDDQTTYYMDDQCNPVAAPNEEEVCGELIIRSAPTPISLVWEDVDLDNIESNLTDFVLNPNQSGNKFTWQASKELPLLVYDPSHTGRVTSVTQLFGNYTFGGRDVLGFNQASNSKIDKKIWSNGYEPLALLDINRDGVIKSEELNPLSLWFDSNKNGISEPGEVRSLSTEGVTELYYTIDKTQSNKDFILASKGYKRLLDEGRIRVGKSIDWNSKSFDNELDAAKYFQQKHTPSISESTQNTREEMSNKSSAIESSQNFAGNWLWTLAKSPNEYKKKGANGILMIRENEQGEIVGKTLTETRLNQNSDNLAFMFDMASIEKGKTLINENGENVIEFSVITSDGFKTESVAKLKSEGSMLMGVSKSEYPASYKSKERLVVEYSWVAFREK